MALITIAPSHDALMSRAAAVLRLAADQAISRQGRFTIALSGGSTPLPLYTFLAQARQADGIDWGKIHFFWGDERPVPPEHPDSNFGQAYQALLEPRQIPSAHIHRIEGEHPPQTAAADYQSELLSFFNEDLPQLDLILLGMGGDGHTASLFPGSEILAETENSNQLVAAAFVPKLDTWRISFTPRLIKAARQIVFLVSGKGKAGTLAQVLDGPYQPEKYPSQLFREEADWLLDQEAASQLTGKD